MASVSDTAAICIVALLDDEDRLAAAPLHLCAPAALPLLASLMRWRRRRPWLRAANPP
jgi:hypothetical protein